MQTQPPDHLGTGELAQTRTHGQAKQPVWEEIFSRSDVAGL